MAVSSSLRIIAKMMNVSLYPRTLKNRIEKYVNEAFNLTWEYISQ